MNENNNGNNMNGMNFNNNQNQFNNNQNMYQQTQMNQMPNQFVMTDDGNFAPIQNEMPQMEQPQIQPEPINPFSAPMQSYNEVPQAQPMPSYNEVPQVQPMPTYNEVPQVQSMPSYNEVPQVQPMQSYNEVSQVQPEINPVPVLDIEEDEVVQTPSDVFGVNVPNEQPQPVQEITGMPMQQPEEEKPKYGYASNEKADLNADENANIKFIIFLAILMLAVIFLLPYLSNLI